MIGLDLQLPGGREGIVEIRREWLGFGICGDSDDREIFLGYIQATISRRRGHTGTFWGKRWLVLVAFLCGLAIPMTYGEAGKLIDDWASVAGLSRELVYKKAGSWEKRAGQKGPSAVYP